jgi:transposase-like protein
MKVESFQALLAQVPSLTEVQLDDLVLAVELRRSKTKSLRILEGAWGAPKCGHCASEQVVKNGHSRGLQRYRCRACDRTFNVTTGTPLAKLHQKERFFQQGECLAKGMTVRDAAAALGVSVSTAFRLRHRFLQAVQAHQPLQVSGLLEADETYFRQSQKGSRKMTRPSRGRGGKATPKGSARDLVPVLIGRVRGTHQVADCVLTAMTAAQAEAALRSVVGPDTLLCTDGSGALRTAASKLGVTSKSIAVSYDGRVSEGVYHVQTVNNYHERFKTWVNRQLRGVSTKHLPNYLAWMRLWEWFKEGVKPEHFVVSGLGKQLINVPATS